MSEQNHEGLPLTQEQRKIMSSKRITMDVSPYEAVIIKELRKYSFGQFIVHLHNGIPLRYTLGAEYAIDPTRDEDILKQVAKP